MRRAEEAFDCAIFVVLDEVWDLGGHFFGGGGGSHRRRNRERWIRNEQGISLRVGINRLIEGTCDEDVFDTVACDNC